MDVVREHAGDSFKKPHSWPFCTDNDELEGAITFDHQTFGERTDSRDAHQRRLMARVQSMEKGFLTDDVHAYLSVPDGSLSDVDGSS